MLTPPWEDGLSVSSLSRTRRAGSVQNLSQCDGRARLRVDADRKGDSEASVGERIDQPLSLAKIHILGADAVAKAEGNVDGR
jgi:hypothetical protein